MPKVFINYRVQDQAGYAALLDRELTTRFGPDAIFRASRSILPGEDFARQILDNLRRCSVLLAVVGPEWLGAGRSHGRRVLGGEPDWVHREIAEALASGIRVIPVLVEDAVLPVESDLPPDIAALARCQYMRLHHRTIERDLERVVSELGQLVHGLATERRVPGELPHTEHRLFALTKPPGQRCSIGVITGTILRVRGVDVWVNSENTELEMSRFSEYSISAIIRYWGARRDQAGRVTADLIAAELAVRVAGRRPVTPGTAFVTGPGELAASHGVRHVIHVAAVHGEPGAGFQQIRQVDRCVTSALTEADRLAGEDPAVRTILFPVLGAGVAGASVPQTVRAMVDAAVDYLATARETPLRAIYFLAYTDLEFAAFEKVVHDAPDLVPIDPSAG